jgi:hypothetical protein
MAVESASTWLAWGVRPLSKPICVGIKGWTFQESLFSRRLLVFNTFVRWICGQGYWAENEIETNALSLNSIPKGMTATGDSLTRLWFPIGYLSRISKFPDLLTWIIIVEQYSPRHLTFETDVNRAIGGATEIFGSAFPGGILHGLPVFFFDLGLLWGRNDRNNRQRRLGQPSWSWTGWKCQIAYRTPWFALNPIPSDSHLTMSNCLPDSFLRPVARYQLNANGIQGTTNCCEFSNFNAFYDYQEYRLDQTLPLPLGWQRHHHFNGEYFTCDASQKQDTRYIYPLPIEETPSANTLYSPVLDCKAPHATAWLHFYNDTEECEVGILEQGDDMIGLINFNDASFTESASCELIAISEQVYAGSTRRKPDIAWGDLMRRRRGLPQVFGTDREASSENGEITYYNVMCIGWESEIAYRRGLGMVKKRDWLSLGPKELTFKLG